MASKNKKTKKLNGADDQPPTEPSENLTEPVSAAADAPVELSPDDLLDDVRRSLIEEDEAAESEKQSKWWRRIGRGSAKSESSAEEPKVEEIDLPQPEEESIEDELDELKDELESQEYLGQIDELIDLLDEAPVAEEKPAPIAEEIPPEPEKVVDLEELKKQAFQPRADAPASESLSEVRSIALEGEEEVFVEVESTPQDPLEERLKSIENALKPYRTYIYFAIAFLGIVMAFVAMTLIYNIYQRSRPAPVAVATSTLPFPTAVNLPGGWSFNLGKGSLANGQWKPKGPEWLEGTEVCRWVSLPWSRQLEAVLRTLNPDDPIELKMSNSDLLVYKVYSIQQMSPEQLQQLDNNTPCLLIMLTENDSDKRWVLTALP